MRRFLTLVCLAVPVMSQAIVIDDFTVPYSRTISTGTWVDYQTDPTLFTGERDVQMEMLMQSSGQAQLSIGGGQLSLLNGAAARSYVQLEYDGIGDEIGNTGEGRVLQHRNNAPNSFPAGTNRVRFFVLSNTANITFEVSLYREGVELFHNGRTRSAEADYFVDVPFSASAFARCDAIILGIYQPALGGQTTLSRVELVPEVSPLAIFGAAGIFLATASARKRQA